MQLLMDAKDVETHRDEWLDLRLQTLGASEIGGVVGRAPATYSSRFQLYWDKLQRHVNDPEEETEAQARGRHLEPYVLERWVAEYPHDLDVRPGGYYRSDAEPRQTATFDALGFANPMLPATVVEIKTTQSRYGADGELVWGEEGTDQIPDHYLCQVYQQMDVAGASMAYVPALFMQSWRLVEYVVHRDEDVAADIAYLRQEGQSFMDSVAAQEPPDPRWCPGPATMRTLQRIHRPVVPDTSVIIPTELADRRVQLKARVKDAETELEGIDTEIRHLMGPAARAVAVGHDGELRTVVSRSIYPRRGYEVKPTEIDMLRPGNYGKV